jgi:carnitine 3-dehydrogenase
LSREVPGYIANRLQNAVFREAMHLVQTGAASVKDIDAAMRFGPGLRWAFMGPFLTYALGGGHGGMRRYFEIFAEEITTSWSDLGNPTLSEDLIEEVIAQTDRLFSKRGVEEIMRGRDTALLSVAKATSRIDLTA